ncbi:unnamed protein product [Oreochromis niloticus]|nr:unnamed protein product [Mustela putorius furo]
MSSVAVFLCLLVILVSGLKELIVKLGEDAPLQCQGPRDAKITVLEWNRADLKSDDYVFLYRNQRPYESYQHVSFRGRVDLMDPSMKDGNVSVMLRNINTPRSPRLSPRMEERGLSGVGYGSPSLSREGQTSFSPATSSRVSWILLSVEKMKRVGVVVVFVWGGGGGCFDQQNQH